MPVESMACPVVLYQEQRTNNASMLELSLFLFLFFFCNLIKLLGSAMHGGLGLENFN